MSAGDQAAGLRRWAEARRDTEVDDPAPAMAGDPPAVSLVDALPARAPAPLIPLMVVGLPDAASRERARATLARWADEGRAWVGDPEAWRLTPVDVASPRLAELALSERRWALWVEGGGEGFRRAYRTLQGLHRQGGPRRLLTLHPPLVSRRGLLDNLQRLAADCFGIELLVLDP